MVKLNDTGSNLNMYPPFQLDESRINHPPAGIPGKFGASLLSNPEVLDMKQTDLYHTSQYEGINYNT